MQICASDPVSLRQLRALPPERLRQLVDSEDARRAIPRDLLSRARTELDAIRRDLQRRTCSQAWFSNCWTSGESFPPPAETSPMVPCSCGRCVPQVKLWPVHYVEPVPGQPAGRLSYECYLESLSDWEAAQLPSSPSGLALRAVREGRVKVRRRRTRLAKGRRVQA